MRSIDQKLIEHKYKFIRKTYLKEELQKLNDHLKRETQTLERLKMQLDKESEDVDRLEHASINRIFSVLSGRSELRLEKEKADAIRAALDYKLKQKDIENLRFQLNLLEQELKPYENLSQEYQGLLDIKRKSLEAEGLQEVRKKEAELDRLITMKNHISTAMNNGKKLCSSFTYILDNLNELVEDTTDARSLWIPLISQDQIDDVRNEIGKMNEFWKSFEEALKMTDVSLPKDFDQDFLLKVSDYMIELDDTRKATKRINTSFEHLNTTYSNVREILLHLELRLQEVEHQIFDQKLSIRSCIECGN